MNMRIRVNQMRVRAQEQKFHVRMLRPLVMKQKLPAIPPSLFACKMKFNVSQMRLRAKCGKAITKIKLIIREIR